MSLLPFASAAPSLDSRRAIQGKENGFFPLGPLTLATLPLQQQKTTENVTTFKQVFEKVLTNVHWLNVIVEGISDEIASSAKSREQIISSMIGMGVVVSILMINQIMLCFVMRKNFIKADSFFQSRFSHLKEDIQLLNRPDECEIQPARA